MSISATVSSKNPSSDVSATATNGTAPTNNADKIKYMVELVNIIGDTQLTQDEKVKNLGTYESKDGTLWGAYNQSSSENETNAKNALESAIKAKKALELLKELDANLVNSSASAGDKLTYAAAKSYINSKDGELQTAINNYNDAVTALESISDDTDITNTKTYLDADKALGAQDDAASNDQSATLYAQRNYYQNKIQEAQNALETLSAAIKATAEYKALIADDPIEQAKAHKQVEQAIGTELIAQVDKASSLEFVGELDDIVAGVPGSDAPDATIVQPVAKDEGESAMFAPIDKQPAIIQAKLKQAAHKYTTKIAQSKKSEVVQNASSITLVQLNNMNKRLGELRGFEHDAGVWMRSYGGRMSADDKRMSYYSIQLGADKDSRLSDDDRMIVGALLGYDKINATARAQSYNAGAYVSYLADGGLFADIVVKYARTSLKNDGHQYAKQNTVLASLEGGYRIGFGEEIYIEPSLELISGYVGKYEDKSSTATISVKSHTPTIIKPQAFVGGKIDEMTYRVGVGGVFSTTSQQANVVVSFDKISRGLTADGSVDLDKNNHGFVSVGTSWMINDNLRLNLSGERSFGGKIKTDYELNATIRYGF